MSYAYVALTIVLTVVGQIAIKWQVLRSGALPDDTHGKLIYLVGLATKPLVLFGLAAALLASFSWMAAMTKLELSHAYPFMSLTFVFVLIASAWILGEQITAPKVVGLGFIVFGLIIGSRG